MSRRGNVVYLADRLRPRSTVSPWIWAFAIAAAVLLAAYLEARHG